MKTDNNMSNLQEDFHNLLNDICDFLSNEIDDKELSPQKLEITEKLIKRIKTQLNQLSTIDTDLPSYVDMTHTKEDASEYIYSDFKEVKPLDCNKDDVNNIKIETKVEKISECPHSGVPAKSIPKDEKSGQLERREKLLFLGHQNKLFAGILGEWLLLYYNERDSRPFETYHLKLFDAKEVKKEQCFSLVPKENISNYKLQIFTALSQKDASQWISKINKISNPQFYVSVAKRVEESGTSSTDIKTNTQSTAPETSATATNFVNDLKVHMGRFSSVQNDNNYDPVGSPRNSNHYCQIPENEYDVVTAVPSDREYDVIQSSELPDEEKIYDCITPTVPKKKSILYNLSFRKKRKQSSK